MVVSLNIVNCDVYHILIDNEILIDILFYDAFSKMGISLDQLDKLNSFLLDFTGDTIPIKGIIILLVMA